MSKLRFYQYLSITLLAGNLFLLWLHFSVKKPPHNGPRKEIIQRLNLDEAQITRYDTLIANHRKSLFALDTKIQQQRKALYTSIGSGNNADSLLQSLNRTQRDIEQLHYAHFRDIRALCKPEQVPAFEQLTQDLAAMFGPAKRGPRPPKP
jgi:Spy/CpxP family protein refolding chaperone